MDDGILKGAEVISLIGNLGGELDISSPENLGEDLRDSGLEECVENRCELGIVGKRNNFLYLTANGQRIYKKLQKQYT